MAINFSAQFIVNEKTSTRVLRLTDTSTGFTLSKGNFIVTFPDGSVVSNTDFSSPQISAPGGNTSISLITDVDNTVLTGTYIINYVAVNTSLNEFTKTETFDFNWEKPAKAIINDSDVVLPEVQFKDLTAYETSGSFTGVLTRNFYTTTPSTSEVGVITKTSVGDILTPSHLTKYYEGIYLVNSDISVAYTHTSKSWLTVAYTDLLQETFDVREAPTQDELVALMNSYKDQIEAYKTTNPSQYEILNEQYDLVLALYSHIIARYQTTTLDGSKAILDQLLGLLPPASSYTYKATQMLPFTINFTTSLTGSGTTGTLPKFTGTATLGDSIIKEDTNRIGIGKTPTTTLDVNGTIQGTSIVKSGGISTQFLKADGSVDANTYLTTGSAASNYQPLDGDLTAIAALAGASGILTKTSANTWTLDTTSYQVLDADLTAIAALAGTSGLLRKTSANTWELDTSVYLTGINSGQITTALGYTPENAANKGVNNGYAGLDSTGKVPSTQLPSYVDDVIEAANVAALPATGETGKIYVTLDTNKIYRWTGSVYVEVSPTVGTIWGGITGTLSNQTDLQSALDAKQGTLTLTTLNTSGPATLTGSTLNIPVYQGGVTSFNTRTGAITLTSSDVTTALGFTPVTNARTLTINGLTQDLSDNRSWTIAGSIPTGGTAGQILAKIDATNYNTQWIDNFASQLKHEVKLGATLTKGKAVYVSSADGTNMIVSAASNASEATSSKTLGLLETGGVTNDIVKVITEGLLAGLDTSTASAGDPVWLGTDGNLIFGLANKPTAPAHLVFIGIVTRVQSNNGEIFVKVQNGFELNEIHDVSIVSKANNEGLFYEASTGLWKNKSIATVLGYTPANGANYLPLVGGTLTGALGGTSATFSSSVTATSFAIPSGSSTGFLKADGSVDLRTFATGTGNINDYLPLTGGSLTNSLSSGYVLSVTNTTEAAGANGLYVNIALGSTGTPFRVDRGGVSLISVNYLGATLFKSTITANQFIKANGTSSEFLMADGSVSTGTSFTYPDAGIVVSTGSAWGTSITDNSSNWNAAYSARIATFTTSGSSGSATFSSNTLNIPTYTLAGLGGQPLATNLTSLSGLTFASTSFVKMTAAGTFALDTNTYLTTAGAAAQYQVIGSYVSGSGSSSRLARWISTTDLSVAQIWDDGTNIGIGQAPGAFKLDVTGTLRVTGAATFSSSVTASSFAIPSGSSTGFLKANGSVDSTTYITSSALSSYLPLSGGTMTGQIILKEASSSTDYTKGLRFPNDSFGGSGDISGLRLYSSSGESQVLELYIGNDAGSDIINFATGVGGTVDNNAVKINGNTIWNAGNLTPQAQLNGTGFVKASGTTISYDNSTYLTTSAASSTYLTITSAAAQYQVIGSYVAGSGSSSRLARWISSSDLSVAQIWDDGTNIGIGQAPGAFKLDVTGTARFTGALSGTSASFSSTLSASSTTLTASANTYAGGALRLNSFTGGTSIYLTSSGGFFALSNGGGADHLLIASTGAATFSSSVTAGAIISTGVSTFTRSALTFTLNPSYGGGDVYTQLQSTGALSLASGGDNNRLYITSGGNVGIGTTSPSGKLHVKGDIVIERTSIAESSTITMEGGEFDIKASPYNYNMRFFTGTSGTSTERMRITSSGNVGIGITSPNRKLEIASGEAVTNGIRITKSSGVTSEGMDITYLDSGNTTTSFDSLYNSNSAVMQFRMKVSGAPTTAMTILGSGNVGIGTTAPGQRLDVNGNIMSSGSSTILMLNNTGGTAQAWWVGQDTAGTNDGIFYIYNATSSQQALNIAKSRAATFFNSVTATSFFESSDKTIKNLIEDNYQAKGIESVTAKLYLKNGVEELGYFAQDVQAILPSAVSKGADGLLNLSYREVHTAKIARLEKRVEELEAQLNLL